MQENMTGDGGTNGRRGSRRSARLERAEARRRGGRGLLVMGIPRRASEMARSRNARAASISMPDVLSRLEGASGVRRRGSPVCTVLAIRPRARRFCLCVWAVHVRDVGPCASSMAHEGVALRSEKAEVTRDAALDSLLALRAKSNVPFRLLVQSRLKCLPPQC